MPVSGHPPFSQINRFRPPPGYLIRSAHYAGEMNLTPKALSLLAIVVSGAAAVASLARIPVLAERFGVLSWGRDFYLLTWLPYVVLALLAILFRGTVTGGTISLIGALVLGGFGIYCMYTAQDALTISFLSFLLLIGCGVILLAQLVRAAAMKGNHPRA